MDGDATAKVLEEALAAGLACFGRGDHAAAIGIYSAAIEQQSRGSADAGLVARLYAARGHSRFIRRELEAAHADYGQALAHDPALAEGHAYRGLIGYQTGKSMQALADYDRAVGLYVAQAEAGAPVHAALSEALFGRGNAQYQRRAFAEAAEDYGTALAFAPDLIDALIYRGVARFQLGELAAAQADYSAALAHPATSSAQQAIVRYNQGMLLRQQGDLAGAVGAYTLALALQPRDADCLMNRGNARAEQGDLAEAIADYEAALALNPWVEDGWNICGMARLTLGDLAGAEADFGRAIQVAPQAAGVHFNRGCARLQLGDLEGAIRDFTRELALHPPGLKGRVETRERRAEILNNRGLAWHYLGHLDEAIADYERSLQQLRQSGGQALVGERMASTLLNRGAAYFERAARNPEQGAAGLQEARADFTAALGLAADPQLAGEIRRQLGALEQQFQPEQKEVISAAKT
jgi:tetratricopeptide (TPR) repeat protein